MRGYVRRILSGRYAVEDVADGAAALAAARQRPPDLLLADVMMPQLDGFAVLRAFRADPRLKAIPVVLLSARAGEEARVEGLEAGADDYLIKPFGARELLARIEAHLELARLRRDNEARLTLLIDELNHRVKNTLATVQSIVSQALRRAAAGADVREAIESRLIALAQSHDLLTQENWESVSLHDVASQAVLPFDNADGDARRFTIRGDAVRCRPKQALALGMAFHELATNAAKYGALSNGTGHVEIAWTVEGGRLRLCWQELGGPPVQPPSRAGFGSRLIERGMARELDGTVSIDYPPHGVTCAVEMPAS